VSFASGADDYDRFMGRYSAPLAPVFIGFSRLVELPRVLDVGCGPGALTSELVRRVGASAVWAVDPSEAFMAAARERLPGVRVERSVAEALPFEDDMFDATLSQLVVHFMADPLAGLREMRRVTKPGGVVAACVWDHAGGKGPLSVFWEAARALDASVDDGAARAGARPGHLGELFRAAGLRDMTETALSVDVEHPGFEEWWEPFTLGVGPAGAFLARLGTTERDRLRQLCQSRLPRAPFVIAARAWATRGLA
jgi:SAM-dependent methyltransferase